MAKRLTKIRKIGLEEYFFGEDSTAYGTEELDEA